MTLTLAFPWAFVLAPLPLAIWLLAPPRKQRRAALVVPFMARLSAAAGARPAFGAVVARAGWGRTVWVGVAWLLVVLAMARPQMIEAPVVRTIPVRDMLLAVDLSGSMETQDFTNAAGAKVDRLAAVKEVLDDFLRRRQGDRVGLIFFGTAPFVQAPFTEDLSLCRRLLSEARAKMAGPQTAFGDALGLAITVFERSELKDRVLIALTDGNDTSSKVPPQKAAEIARDKGIVIHTVAVGDPRAAGEDALDVETLRRVAATTSGLASFAADRTQLEAIYRKLDELQTRKAQTISHRPRRDIFWWPLGAALALTMLQQAWQTVRQWRRSRQSATLEPAVTTEAAA